MEGETEVDPSLFVCQSVCFGRSADRLFYSFNLNCNSNEVQGREINLYPVFVFESSDSSV